MRTVAQIWSVVWCLVRILVVIAVVPIFAIPAFFGIAISIPILVVYGPFWGIRQFRKRRRNETSMTESRGKQQPLLS